MVHTDWFSTPPYAEKHWGTSPGALGLFFTCFGVPLAGCVEKHNTDSPTHPRNLASSPVLGLGVEVLSLHAVPLLELYCELLIAR